MLSSKANEDYRTDEGVVQCEAISPAFDRERMTAINPAPMAPPTTTDATIQKKAVKNGTAMKPTKASDLGPQSPSNRDSGHWKIRASQ
jgi:hypothetical protein